MLKNTNQPPNNYDDYGDGDIPEIDLPQNGTPIIETPVKPDPPKPKREGPAVIQYDSPQHFS